MGLGEMGILWEMETGDEFGNKDKEDAIDEKN